MIRPRGGGTQTPFGSPASEDAGHPPEVRPAGSRSHTDAASAELARINAELARLLDRPPAPLVTGADSACRDPLVVCGLLGGKDVGKSTLINALAGREISIDREEVGAGTSRPLVYVHRDMIATARSRLAEIARLTPTVDLQFFPHEADAIRNVALVDLPDFDSDFRQHEVIARGVSPYLDRVVWVVTPRKIADRAWVAFAHDVVQATANVYFVLNKADELLADEEGWSTPGRSPIEVKHQAECFAREQGSWACDVLQQAGYEVREDRLFLLAAKYPRAGVLVERVAAIWDDPQWRRYAPDRDVVTAIGERFTRDLDRLREIVLAPVDAEQAARIKEDNLRAQVRQNAARIQAHFELDHWVEEVSRVLGAEYRQTLLNAAFGPEFCRTLAVRLLRSRRTDVDLADEVMDARAGRWPVLRVVYWLSRWAIRRLGRAMAGSAAREGDRHVPTGSELFRIRARGLTDRVASVVDRLQAEHGPAIRQLRLGDELPEPADVAAQIEAELAELPLRGDEELVDRLSRGYRASAIGRLLIVGAVVWFPFVQPVAEGLLQMVSAGMSLTDWLHGLYRVVVALGAVQLLHGLAVVALIDVAALAAIYSRCVRDVQAGRSLAAASRPTEPGAPATGSPDSSPTLRRRRPAIVGDRQQEIDLLAQEIDTLLLAEVMGPALRPLEVAGGQLAEAAQRLNGIGA
ncbi:MAG: hypothetical protein HY718_18315 [Planctomycetes bacterium]|nr:hypothetical protein [Planctomycetota bacterium]